MNGLQDEVKPTLFRENAWAEALRSHEFARVERRMLRQLIETLLYERIVVSGHMFDPDGKEEERFEIYGTSAEGVPAAYIVHGRLKRSFARIRLSRRHPIERLGPDGELSEARLSLFVWEVLGPRVPQERLEAFSEELLQTLLKDIQAQFANPLAELRGSERSYDALEGNVMDGHPYHPSYKSRIGFSLSDNEAYGPEFKPALKLIWLAVPAQDSEQAVSDSLCGSEFMQAELGAEVLAGFAAKLREAGKRPDDYRFVPVHPWQWRESTVRVFYRQLADGRMIVLGEGADEYRPQQSIRTLANISRRERAYVKLPMNLINTSTKRTLAKHTILNAPLISDWLARLIEQDEEAVRMDFVLLREVAGVAFDHEAMPEPDRQAAYGTLGAIWRESLHGYLRSGEEAAPFNALCHVERTGKPFIDPWIRQVGLEAWTRKLLLCSIEPLLHLLFAHGVALESHAQNMVLIHRDGSPVRVAFKDFHDGIRFSRAHLTAPDACPALHSLPSYHARVNPNSFIETDEAEGVRDFVHDAFFFINLSELCFFLEEHYGLPEERFWGIAAEIIHGYQSSHPQHEARFRAFDLFTETIRVEQLTSRRLFGDAEVRLQAAPNPLHPFR
ncbi:IucA/IucC family protein [Paenibacillus chartarius]|uniref:IucA/IucC family protein n=1 Tax=Paenibacillus chartarius TaxID=747481 RepID=A0ABV6DT32_9BACL